jgi:glucose-6-phosphate 1-dehydrogenase
MNISSSDALIFFGATGDLAHKKIFPALQAMVKRGTLNAPVIDVSRGGWNLERLRARARDSLEKHGGIDPAAFDKLCRLLRYVDGECCEPNLAFKFSCLCFGSFSWRGNEIDRACGRHEMFAGSSIWSGTQA